MRILIAEDDQVLADGLLRGLRAAGYAVDQVGTGTEADAALSAHEFDLLILDLGLPKMHGLDVLKRLRSRGSHVPVLILTAADSVEQRVKGLDLGADDYMAKPFSLQELEARVRALTRRGLGTASSVIRKAGASSQASPATGRNRRSISARPAQMEAFICGGGTSGVGGRCGAGGKCFTKYLLPFR